MAEEAKLIPQVTRELKPFFDAARNNQLAVQKCDNCGTLRFPAAPLCLACDSPKASWVPVSGKGEVFSFTVMHRAYHPAIKVPYTLAVIELKEGAKITSNVIGIEPVQGEMRDAGRGGVRKAQRRGHATQVPPGGELSKRYYPGDYHHSRIIA